MKVIRRIFPLALVLVIFGGSLALLTPTTTADSGCTNGCPKWVDKINIYYCVQLGCPAWTCSGGCAKSLWGCAEFSGGEVACGYCTNGDFCTE